MDTKKKVKMLVDFGMIVSMPVLMAYELASATLHEWLGIAIFLLFLLHHGLNLGWYKSLLKGRYSAVRLWSIVINTLLFAIMVALPVSGLAMAKHIPLAFSMLNTLAARTLHLTASYWGYVLISIHVGLHGGMIGHKANNKISENDTLGWKHILPCLLAMIAMTYGGYAFIHRDFGRYMFLKSQFVFFDFSEPLVYLLGDYFAIMWFFVCIGFCFSRSLRRLDRPKLKRSN